METYTDTLPPYWWLRPWHHVRRLHAAVVGLRDSYDRLNTAVCQAHARHDELKRNLCKAADDNTGYQLGTMLGMLHPHPHDDEVVALKALTSKIDSLSKDVDNSRKVLVSKAEQAGYSERNWPQGPLDWLVEAVAYWKGEAHAARDENGLTASSKRILDLENRLFKALRKIEELEAKKKKPSKKGGRRA